MALAQLQRRLEIDFYFGTSSPASTLLRRGITWRVHFIFRIPHPLLSHYNNLRLPLVQRGQAPLPRTTRPPQPPPRLDRRPLRAWTFSQRVPDGVRRLNKDQGKTLQTTHHGVCRANNGCRPQSGEAAEKKRSWSASWHTTGSTSAIDREVKGKGRRIEI